MANTDNIVKIVTGNDHYVGTTVEAKNAALPIVEKLKQYNEVILDVGNVFGMTIEYAEHFMGSLVSNNFKDIAGVDDKELVINGARTHIQSQLERALANISKNARNYGDEKDIRNNVVAIKKTMENAKLTAEA